MKNVRSICVFCGSRTGNDPAYEQAARELGGLLAEKGIRLVYGGGSIGLMGVVAKAALDHGGEVLGVIPRFLEEMEVGGLALATNVVVESMHARKAKMFAAADAFVVLPGGLGTLDEMIEITTWKQLRQHDKPIIIIDVKGYWSILEEVIARVISAGFAHPKISELWAVVRDPGEVLEAITQAPQPDDVVLNSHLERL